MTQPQLVTFSTVDRLDEIHFWLNYAIQWGELAANATENPITGDLAVLYERCRTSALDFAGETLDQWGDTIG